MAKLLDQQNFIGRGSSHGMEDIKSKFSVCPVCSNKLINVENTLGSNVNYLCTDSGCRLYIENNYICRLDIFAYSKLVDKLGIKEISYDTYMLLKENLSGPLLQRLTTNYNEKDKSLLCIVKATSKEDAISKFRRKFSFIKITSDMVVPVTIKEEGW